MKVHICVDMEGIAGIVSWHQDDEELTRRLMTGETNAAIAGAAAAGADEIVVADSHNTMRNLFPDQLRPEARLISGVNRPLSMMEGIDSSFSASILVGMHAAMGTKDAVLDHTYSGEGVANVLINGRRMGEIGINAGLAGYFGVPVVCVTGDEAATREAAELLGDVVTVPVKRGIGRYGADSLHPASACELIEARVRTALSATPVPPLRFDRPVLLQVDFMTSAMADNATLIPGATRVDGRSVTYCHEDYSVVFKAMLAMLDLAAAGSRG